MTFLVQAVDEGATPEVVRPSDPLPNRQRVGASTPNCRSSVPAVRDRLSRNTGRYGYRLKGSRVPCGNVPKVA
jgi:hypothetical protein